MNRPLEQVLPVLRARWIAVVLTWIVVVAAAVALTVALPPRYEATATVVVELAGIDPIAGQTIFKPAGAVSTHVATQVEILKSEEVALGAVRRLGLPERQEWRDRWQTATRGHTDFQSWLAGQVLRTVKVRPAPDSNVLTLSYSSEDPKFSADVANALVQSFIDTTLQMRAGPARKFSAFFAERAKPLREALDQARARLSAYEKEHGVVVGDQPDVEGARLAELTSQLVTLQDAHAEATKLQKQAQAAPGEMREVRNDPEVAVLIGELVRLEGELAELKAEFGEKHHAVIRTRQSIGDVKRRLDAAMQRAAESLGTPLKVIEARLAEVQKAIDRQRTIVLQRKSQRDAAAALLRDVQNAEKAYSGVLTRASETALESANTTETSVSILKAATPPLWSPSLLIRNTLVALLAGLLLGITAALLRESRDPRLRTIEDVTRRLRQPLLLALPDGQARRARRSEHTRQRLVSAQPRLAAPQWNSPR